MMNMSQPPPSAPPMAPPSSGPPAGGGHGTFSDEDIQQIMQDTGMTYEQVSQAIDQAGPGVTTKEQLLPQIYSGGIQPQQPADGQMESPSAMQGQPPPQPGAAPPMAPPEVGEGEPPQSAGAEMAEGEGIDPAVAQAIHAQMRPRPDYKRRPK